MPPITGKAKVERLHPAGSRTESARLDLSVRPRRNRKAGWTRRLVAENMLTTDDLVWPVFLCDGERKREPVASMPGVERYSVDEALRAAEQAMKAEDPGTCPLSRIPTLPFVMPREARRGARPLHQPRP
jgi:porphobilinogen synthase